MSKAKPRTRRTRSPLTRERVVAEAVLLADEQGLEGVTMRLLARRLGVEAMSLYNHVTDKNDLLDGMADRVITEIALPAPCGEWKSEMRRRCVSARAAFLRHAWAPPLIASRLNPGPAMLRYIDATLGCLRAAGFSYALADHAWNAIDSHLYGFTLLERSLPLEPKDFAAAATEFLPLIPRDTYPHMHALATLVGAGAHSGVNEFEFGLTLILDGLERLRGAH